MQEMVAYGIIFAIALALASQRWFWILLFLVGGLASCFAMIASVIHFQIFAGVGFFFLMAICGGIVGILTDPNSH